MFKRIWEDIGCVFGRDPAVRSKIEVFFCYPGFHALLFYHVAHWLWESGFRLLGRFVSHVGRMVTGIEIHPGARSAAASSSTTAWAWSSARPR